MFPNRLGQALCGGLDVNKFRPKPSSLVRPELIVIVFRQEMIYNTNRKTIHWEFVKSLEPPRITHMRAVEVINKTNHFGQITVRFHTQQVRVAF